MSFIARVLTTIDCTRAATVPQFLPDESNQAEFVICDQSIEQDHRRVKHRLRPMLGLKSIPTAAVVISGIELAEKIRKGQYKTGKLGGRTATMPAIWQAALAA
jgi:transposase-like protein